MYYKDHSIYLGGSDVASLRVCECRQIAVYRIRGRGPRRLYSKATL